MHEEIKEHSCTKLRAMFTTINIINVLFTDFTSASAASALLVVGNKPTWVGSDTNLEWNVDQLIDLLNTTEFDLYKHIL
jgi:hypothetical protein